MVKKRLLLFLMLFVTVLSALTLVVTAYTFREQEKAMDSMMSSYVLDLAESVGGNFSAGMRQQHRGRGHGRGMMHFRMLSMTPALQNAESGGIIVLNEAGQVLTASPGAEKLLPFRENPSIAERPSEVLDDSGRSYYAVLQDVGNGIRVLAAVSKSHLLRPMVGVWRFGLVSATAMSAILLAGMFALWKYLVAPLRSIVEGVGNTKWGRERPRLPVDPFLFEIKALSQAITKLGDEAVSKEDIKVRYVNDLVQGQETTRKQLARELHDGPLQGVVAAIKRIQLARDALSASAESPASEHLETAENVSQDAAREIRTYCDELSPSWIKLGLESAMNEQADRLSRIYGIDIGLEVDYDLSETISEEQVLAVVRILQEAVSNSVRHGESRRLQVKLEKRNEFAHLAIQDDGKGFQLDGKEETDYEHLRTTGHRGLANMNERTQLLQGNMRLISKPGQGCRIEIGFPIKK